MSQAIRCAQCKGPVQVETDQATFLCGYCGTQNKNPVYQPPQIGDVPPEETLPENLRGSADSRSGVVDSNLSSSGRPTHKGAVKIMLGLLALCLGAVAIAQFWVVDHRSQPARVIVSPPAGPGPAENLRWDSGRPFVVDANGDGWDEVVGRVDQEQTKFVACLDSRDASLLWKSQPIEENSVAFLAGNMLLLARDQSLRALDRRTGKTAWKAALADAVSQVALVENTVRLLLKNGTWQAVRLTDGQVSASAPPEPPVVFLREDGPFPFAAKYPLLDLPPQPWPGLRVVRAFCEPGAEGGLPGEYLGVTPGNGSVTCSASPALALALGRQAGRVAPFLVGYAPPSRELLWQRPLDPSEAAGVLAEGQDQPRAVIRGGLALLVYRWKRNSPQVILLDLATGETRWKKTLGDVSGANGLYGAMLGSRRAFLKFGWGPVRVFVLSNGREVAPLLPHS